MKQKKSEDSNPYRISYDDYLDTNASTECTGLMYQPAKGREEWEQYHEVFNFYPGHLDEEIPKE